MEKSLLQARGSVKSIETGRKSNLNKSYYRSSSVVSSSVSIVEKVKDYSELKQIRVLSHTNFSIYLVFNEKTFEYLVMKVFPTKEGEPSAHFLRASHLSSLWHENIIQIIDIKFTNKSRPGYADRNSYLLCVLAPYGNLDTLLRKKDICGDEILARTYFQQLISALDYLHSSGIYHQNLHLGHLLIGEHFKLKLCGFSNISAEGLPRIQSQGTKGFRSPQLKNFYLEPAAHSDVYAAGIILFVLYTGMLPYKEDLRLDEVDLWSLLRENEAAYWSAYHDVQSQMIIDNDSFKRLFIGMTKYDHEKRMTIEEVKKSSWFNGPVYSDKKLIEVMKNRVKLVPILHSPRKKNH